MGDNLTPYIIAVGHIRLNIFLTPHFVSIKETRLMMMNY